MDQASKTKNNEVLIWIKKKNNNHNAQLAKRSYAQTFIF